MLRISFWLVFARTVDDPFVALEFQEISAALAIQVISSQVRFRDFPTTKGNHGRLYVMIAVTFSLN